MADYYPLIARAVGGLSPNTREAREAIYARAREALTRQLSSLDPPIPEADLWRERNALEETFRKIEATFPPPPPPIRTEVRPVVPAPSDVPPVVARPPQPKPQDPVHPQQPPRAVVPPPEETETTQRPVIIDPTDTEATPAPVAPPKRPKIEVDRSRAFKGQRLTAALIALPILLAFGALAYILRDSPGMYERKESAQPQSDVAAAQRKSDGRLDGSAPATSVSGPRPAPQQQSIPTLPVAARAIFFEETASDPRGVQSDGQVIWRLETVPSGPGQPPETAARGSVAFPNARMGLEIVFKRNKEASLPASHTVELVFKPEGEREGVAEIGPIETRDQEAQPGYQLRGAMVPVGVNLFLIGLDRAERVTEKNVESIRDQRYFAFQFRMTNSKVGAILIEKGPTGERVFREAVEAWKR